MRATTLARSTTSTGTAIRRAGVVATVVVFGPSRLHHVLQVSTVADIWRIGITILTTFFIFSRSLEQVARGGPQRDRGRRSCEEVSNARAGKGHKRRVEVLGKSRLFGIHPERSRDEVTRRSSNIQK